MKELDRINHDKILDLLLARVAFERTGVKLYDAIIDDIQQMRDPNLDKMLGQLREHREDEKEHEEWLEEQIRGIGGDPDAESPHRKLETEEGSGIEHIMFDKNASLHDKLHALLLAELADNAGWDLLVELADEADDSDAKRAFKKRLHEEEEHLILLRRAVQRQMRRDVLHQDVSMPSWP